MSVPEGFYEKITCESIDSAFLRGVLLTPGFMEEHERRHGAGTAFFDLVTSYPRWTLYGGPFETALEAQQFGTRVGQWAQRNGLIWYIKPLACIYGRGVFGWPRTRFQWDWVWESAPPAKVKRAWTGERYEYVYA